MKIIIAVQSGKDVIGYINADHIISFNADKNPYDGGDETKIYFNNGTKSIIKGDRTKDICDFMAADNDSGILNLIRDSNNKSYWNKDGNFCQNGGENE